MQYVSFSNTEEQYLAPLEWYITTHYLKIDIETLARNSLIKSNKQILGVNTVDLHKILYNLIINTEIYNLILPIMVNCVGLCPKNTHFHLM